MPKHNRPTFAQSHCKYSNIVIHHTAYFAGAVELKHSHPIFNLPASEVVKLYNRNNTKVERLLLAIYPLVAFKLGTFRVPAFYTESKGVDKAYIVAKKVTRELAKAEALDSYLRKRKMKFVMDKQTNKNPDLLLNFYSGLLSWLKLEVTELSLTMQNLPTEKQVALQQLNHEIEVAKKEKLIAQGKIDVSYTEDTASLAENLVNDYADKVALTADQKHGLENISAALHPKKTDCTHKALCNAHKLCASALPGEDYHTAVVLGFLTKKIRAKEQEDREFGLALSMTDATKKSSISFTIESEKVYTEKEAVAKLGRDLTPMEQLKIRFKKGI